MFRWAALLRSAVPVRSPKTVSLHDWLRAPCNIYLPDANGLTPLDISRVLSVLSSRSPGTISREYLESCLEELSRALQSHSRSQADIVSSIHVLDRIAANCIVHERTTEIVELLTRSGELKVNKTDAFLGARAALLLGHSELASRLMTPSQARSLALSNLIQLGTLSLTSNDTALQSVIHQELVNQLESSEELHSTSSTDLVLGIRAIAKIGVTSRLASSRTTRTMKKAGTELVRRIELKTISPQSAVDLIEAFSGQPPCPIHPMLLQAAFAYLLENRNYTCLSRDEISRVLHASSLAEIENSILTSHLVSAFIRADMIDDPRINLRALSGASLSRTSLSPSCVSALTCCGSLNDVKNGADKSVLLTALANLAGYGPRGVCSRTIERFVVEDSANGDCITDASARLLVLAALPTLGSSVCEVPARFSNARVPGFALEITEKSNPAMPRSDIKKKRLAKRVASRGLEMFDSVVSPEVVETRDCDHCTHEVSAAEKRLAAFRRTIRRCRDLVKLGPDASLEWKEMTQSVSDIIVALTLFDWEPYIYFLTVDDLRVMDELLDECLSVMSEAEEPHLAFEEGIHDVESSVVRIARLVAGGYVSAPLITNSNHRVAVEIRQ